MTHNIEDDPAYRIGSKWTQNGLWAARTPKLNAALGAEAAKKYFVKLGLSVTVLLKEPTRENGRLVFSDGRPTIDYYIGLAHHADIAEAVEAFGAKAWELVA